MTWLRAGPDVLVCVGLFFAPGLLVTYLGGLRGITAWATAPLVTVGLVAAVAVAGGTFGFRFGLWPVVAGVGVLACLSAALSMLLRARGVERPPRDSRTYSLAVVIGAVAAAVIGGLTFITGVKRPDAISESWDAVFHYNAVRYIEQTGKASPLTISTLGQPGAHGGFYPDAWHVMAALLAELTGAPIPVAATVTCLVVAILVWPSGCLLLARHLFGASGPRAVPAVIITGLVCSLFAAFPWMLTGGWGVVWPNALGMALAPAGVALGLSITQISEGDTFGTRKWFFGAMGAWAIAIAHPNSALSLAVICLIPVLMFLRPRLANQYGRHPFRTVLLLLASMAAGGGLVALSVPMLGHVMAQVYPTFETPGQAVVSAATDATDRLPPELLLATFSLIGIVACFVWRQRRWLFGAGVMIVALYVGSAAVGSHLARLFTGFWYNDSHRIAATLPIVAIPLTTAGVLFIGEYLKQWLQSVVFGAAVAGPALALAVPLALGTAVTAVTAARNGPENAYVVGWQFNDDRLVGRQKLQAFETVARHIPASALVADNPFDGTAFMPALSGTHVLFPVMDPASNDRDMAYLASNLVHLSQNPRACNLVRHYGVDYMIIAPDLFWIGHRNPGFYPGVADPVSNPGFRLVAADGPVRLYKITICQPSNHQPEPIDAVSRGGS